MAEKKTMPVSEKKTNVSPEDKRKALAKEMSKM